MTHEPVEAFASAGFLASFLIEIPTGYFADRFGHKNSLILAKVFKILSTLSFVLGTNIYWFVAGSVFGALGFALQSGTQQAFVHETLK